MAQKEEEVGKFRRRKWLGGWWGWDGREWVKREDNWKGGSKEVWEKVDWRESGCG